MIEYDWTACTYEQLLLNTGTEVNRILRRLQLEYSAERERAEHEVSKTNFNQTAPHKTNYLEDWKSFLTQSDKQAISDLLRTFNINLYNVEDAMPSEGFGD